MAHIYLRFDFGTDEEKAQLARHKLEVWKQAFRLDKKLLYKFERSAVDRAAPEKPAEETAEKQKAAKAEAGKAKGKARSAPKSDAKKEATEAEKPSTGNVKLLVRLGFSGHEKLSEQRWVERVPSEDPFSSASPVTIKTGEGEFDAIETRFEELE